MTSVEFGQPPLACAVGAGSEKGKREEDGPRRRRGEDCGPWRFLLGRFRRNIGVMPGFSKAFAKRGCGGAWAFGNIPRVQTPAEKVPEWSNGAVSKTVVGAKSTQGSNSLSLRHRAPQDRHNWVPEARVYEGRRLTSNRSLPMRRERFAAASGPDRWPAGGEPRTAVGPIKHLCEVPARFRTRPASCAVRKRVGGLRRARRVDVGHRDVETKLTSQNPFTSPAVTSSWRSRSKGTARTTRPRSRNTCRRRLQRGRIAGWKAAARGGCSSEHRPAPQSSKRTGTAVDGGEGPVSVRRRARARRARRSAGARTRSIGYLVRFILSTDIERDRMTRGGDRGHHLGEVIVLKSGDDGITSGAGRHPRGTLPMA